MDIINFKVKENTGNDFCPRYLYAFVGDSDITFRSEEMTAWYEYDDTNDKNHIARRINEAFDLPMSGNSFDT